MVTHRYFIIFGANFYLNPDVPKLRFSITLDITYDVFPVNDHDNITLNLSVLDKSISKCTYMV